MDAAPSKVRYSAVMRRAAVPWSFIIGLALLFAVCVATPLHAAAAGNEARRVLSPDLHEMNDWGEHARTAKIMLVLFQLAAMLIAAKLMGWASERIGVPGVVGELLAGVIIGPYVLGQLVMVPLAGHWAPLFPAPLAGEWPVNDVIWAFAQFASIILLFVTGLHTDLQQFLKYVGPASLVATVGLLAPFALGFATVYYVPSFREMAAGSPGESPLIPALFIGAILAATSIGITARVLGDINRLDTPEGVTILGAAVLDDVLGIIALAIVGGIAERGEISAGSVGIIASKAFGFWIALTVVILLLARRIELLLTGIRYSGAMIALAIALAFVCSGAAESFGLAFIIGAYSVGLGLSRTRMAHDLMEKLEPIADFIVPIFFAALGMLVNVRAMFASTDVIVFGVAITAVAVIGKLIGCGGAALPMGFNLRGGYRIGVGMLPRGEVALIVAGIGLSRQLVGEVVFGVSIMMTLITTIVAPILLVPAFRHGGSGRRKTSRAQPKLPADHAEMVLEIPVPKEFSDHVVKRLLQVAESSGWTVAYDRADEDTYLLRSNGEATVVALRGGIIRIDGSQQRLGEFKSYLANVRRELTVAADNLVPRTSDEPTA